MVENITILHLSILSLFTKTLKSSPLPVTLCYFNKHLVHSPFLPLCFLLLFLSVSCVPICTISATNHFAEPVSITHLQVVPWQSITNAWLPAQTSIWHITKFLRKTMKLQQNHHSKTNAKAPVILHKDSSTYLIVTVKILVCVCVCDQSCRFSEDRGSHGVAWITYKMRNFKWEDVDHIIVSILFLLFTFRHNLKICIYTELLSGCIHVYDCVKTATVYHFIKSLDSSFCKWKCGSIWA